MIIRLKSNMSDLLSLTKDLLQDIFEYFTLRELLIFESVSAASKCFIRKTKWSHVIASFRKKEFAPGVIRSYNFMHYDLMFADVDDEDLSNLTHCLSVNLSFCDRVTDAGYAHLINCKKITLDKGIPKSEDEKMTNENLKHFSKCEEVKLGELGNITDEGLACLKGCRALTMNTSESLITGSAFQFLPNLRKIHMASTNNISPDSFAFLSGCDEVHISHSLSFTDAAVKYLANCDKLTIEYCHYVTDDSVKLLGNVRVLRVRYCNKITTECRSSLKNWV